jgi:nifR3 family TIM-barrel protein
MVKIGNIELGNFPLLLAPMEDVSDPPFRAVCKEGGADLMYTEFISSEGLIRHAAKSKQKLDIFEYERPIGVQLFGGEIGSMIEATQIATEVNPDLIDINYGCPVKAVACRGSGAALLQDIPKMVKMTSEVVKATNLPVTVKTRLGWDDKTKNITEVAERLQDIGIKALTVHGRTRVQMYKGDADWTLIGEIKNNPRIQIPIFGNGDIDSTAKAKMYRDLYGVDGLMIGRSAIGYPWIFNEIKHYIQSGAQLPKPTVAERVSVTNKHLEFSIRWKGDKLGVLEMRRHYASYFKGIPDFKQYRNQLVEAPDAHEVYSILDEVIDAYSALAVL